AGRWPATDTGPVVDEGANGMRKPRAARESGSHRRYAQRVHLRGHTRPLSIPDGDDPRRLSDKRRRPDGLHELREAGTNRRHRAIIDARAWTEASVVLNIFAASHILGLYPLGAYTAHNEAESLIFRLGMQDVGRQLSYGVQHLRYFLSKKIDRRAEIHNYLNK